MAERSDGNRVDGERRTTLELFEQLHPKDQLDRLMILLEMPKDYQPSLSLSIAQRGNHIFDYYAEIPNGLQKLAEALRHLIKKQGDSGKQLEEKPVSANVPSGSESLQALPEEVHKRIEWYRNRVAHKEYGMAFHDFFEWPEPEKSLNYLLDFVYNRCDHHLNLVCELFPDGIDKVPLALTRSQRAKVLNALARGYKNTGQLDRAIKTFRRQLVTEEVLTGETGVKTLTNFVNTIRLAGRLREAREWAHKLLLLSQGEAPKSIGYSLYWNGIIAAACGQYNEAELLLRLAETVFELIVERDNHRGLGRTYAHLAQLELWLGHAQMALRLAEHSYNFAVKHKESRELIFTTRLMGMAALKLGNCLDSTKLLQTAWNDASKVGYVEEQLAAEIGLAEMDHRANNLQNAEQRLREVEDRAQEGSYVLLRVDALNALAQVLRDSGRHAEAIKTAQKAYKCAWCDGPPYAYDRGLRTTKQLLAELRAELPQVAGHNNSNSLESQYESLPCDERCLEKASLRLGFFKYLRIIASPYRYAPTKFIKLLQEDWDAVCRIVSNLDVMLPPQHVEIHVGEPCNLSCIYCRGELRDVPNRREKFLPKPVLERLVNEIHLLNSNAFIRFSGLIGEPLLHPNIVEVFNFAHQKGLKWGVTTNGLRMAGKVLEALMKAEYVHVSLDAGSDRTYQQLKKGQTGDFDKVLRNVEEIVRRRMPCGNRPQVIVSVLLQTENFRELITVSQRLKEIGVDSLEIKMQHFDARRWMSEDDVKEAYCLIDEVRRLDDGRFRVVVVQSKEQALDKVREGVKRITFPRCYASGLGLNATIDPEGNLQTCCQYYQNTLGVQGHAKMTGFGQVWMSGRRMEILRRDPRGQCVNCSPSDEFVNEFVDFLRKANERDGDFLEWVRKQIELVFKA